jgi:uncharacterized membrane protein YedE/YeeE
MHIVMALVAGLVFGLGLIVSGMTDPSRVVGFLDLAGRWDPSLAFVMGGAILVGLVAFRFAAGRDRCWAAWPSAPAGAGPATAPARRWHRSLPAAASRSSSAPPCWPAWSSSKCWNACRRAAS